MGVERGASTEGPFVSWVRKVSSCVAQLINGFVWCNHEYPKTELDRSTEVMRNLISWDVPQGKRTFWLVYLKMRSEEDVVPSNNVRRSGFLRFSILRLFSSTHRESMKQSVEPKSMGVGMLLRVSVFKLT